MNETPDLESHGVITKTEREELRQIKLEREIKEEVLSWAKRWATVITILTAVVGIIGINVVVANVLRGFVDDDIRMAQESTMKSQIAMDRAINIGNKYVESVKDLQETAENLKDELSKIEKSLEGSRKQSSALTKQSVEDISIRIRTLEEALTELLPKNRSKELSETLSKSEDEAEKRTKIFTENSEYTLELSSPFESGNKTMQEVEKVFIKNGFQTRIYYGKSREVIENSYGVTIDKSNYGNKPLILFFNDDEGKAKEISNILKLDKIIESTQFIEKFIGNDKVIGVHFANIN